MIFKNFNKSIRVIGMFPTSGVCNAEKNKECIETIVNRYEFYKNKIIGVNCDQGSSLIRLFKQNENYLFDRDIETKINEFTSIDSDSPQQPVQHNAEQSSQLSTQQSSQQSQQSSLQSQQSSQASTHQSVQGTASIALNNDQLIDRDNFDFQVNMIQIDSEIQDIVDGYDDEDYLDSDYELSVH